MWKRLDSALRGEGDVDASVYPTQLQAATDMFVSESLEKWDAQAVVACDHVPSVRLHLALGATSGPAVAELDVMYSDLHRLGYPWGTPQKFLDLSQINNEGIRELRPGAQVIVGLMTMPLGRGTAAKPQGQRKEDLMQALSDDYEGAISAIPRLLPELAIPRALKFVQSLRRGELDINSARIVVFAGLFRSLRSPSTLARRFKHASRNDCSVVHLAKSREIGYSPGEILFAGAEEGHLFFKP